MNTVQYFTQLLAVRLVHNSPALNSIARYEKNEQVYQATLIGTSHCLQSFPTVHSFSVASTTLTPADKVTTFGVILNSKLTFDAQVSAVCKNAHFHLRPLRHIRHLSPMIWPPPLQMP